MHQPAMLGSTPVVAWWTDAAAGDLRSFERLPGTGSVDAQLTSQLSPSEIYAVDLAWRTPLRLHQVHGAEVSVVRALPRDELVIGDGDAIVVASDPKLDQVVAMVLVADCAAVALAGTDGTMAVVHAGWRGLVAGVVQRAVETMRSMSDCDVLAGLGPCAHACCYAFGASDLALVAARYGPAVAATTSDGEPALDLPTAVRSALSEVGVGLVLEQSACTICGGAWFSHRRDGDLRRQGLLVWRS